MHSLRALITSSATPTEKQIWQRLAAFWSVTVFATLYCPEYVTEKLGKHHHPIFEAVAHGTRGQKINIVAPRGSAKSTIMAVIYPLHCIYFKAYYELLDMQPERFIFILSQSHRIAASRVRAIMRKIETDPHFQHLRGKSLWGNNRAETANGVLLVPQGRGGQVRGELYHGHRPSLITSDDIDDAEGLRNPDLRAKDQEWFDTDLLRAGALDGTTNFINIDTVKHAESTASLLRDRPGWQTLFFQAIESPADLWHPHAEDRWREWEQLYTDMELPEGEREQQAETFYEKYQTELTADVKELWPEAITYLDVRKEICDVGYYAVLRELQNSTQDPSQALFDMETAIRFEVTKEGFVRSDNRLIKWEEMAGATVFLDWAGGKDLAENAYAAAVAVVWVPLPGSRQDKTDSLMDGVHGYVFDVALKRTGATEQIAMCFEMMQRLRREIPRRDLKIRFGVEGFVQDTWNAQKQVIERDYRAQREAQKIRDAPHLEWLTRLRNKFDRIDALQPLIRNGWLSFRKGLQGEFMKQLALYPTADFLDGPDALEGACQLRVTRFAVERQTRRDTFAQKNRNFKVRV